MPNGNTECASVLTTPHPITVVPASGVPSTIPVEVEPAGGNLVKRKRGRIPTAKTYRMEILEKFITGDIPKGELGMVDFIRVSQLTPSEKSYLVNHACFKERYDARLFDMFIGLEPLITKEDLKLLEIVGRRLGLSKPSTQLNVQVNNNRGDKKDDGAVNIKVQR